MTPEEARRVPLRRHRPFALYWIARVSGTFALQMQAVAVAWQMYDLTRNPLDLGLVGLVQFIPAALFVLIAGHFADRYNRSRIVRTCQWLAGLATAVLALGTAGGWLGREALLAIVFVIGAARSFEQTTLSTLLPGIVPLPMLPRATAAAASATQVAVIAGPALGGLLYAVNPILVYALCSVLFMTGGLLISLVRAERTAVSREPLSLAVLFAGFAFMRRNPVVLGTITLDLFAVILGGVFALLPVFARDVFEAGPWGLGLLRAAPGIGALAAALVLTRWPPRRWVGRIMFGAVATYGVAILIFALSRSFALSLALLCLLGAADMISVVIRMTIIQLETPDDMRGRVSAVNSLFVTASNQLGDFRAGVMAAWLGTIPAVMVGGIGASAGGGRGPEAVRCALSRRDAGQPAPLSAAVIAAHRLLHGRLEPVLKKIRKPHTAGVVMQQAAFEMGLAGLGVRQHHALMAARGPTAHGGMRHIHVELQREGTIGVAEGLHRKAVAFRQQHRPARKIEALTVPLIDVVRPLAAYLPAGHGRPDRVITDFGMAVRMLVDPRAELLRQHLRAETDAEERLFLRQHHADPVDLATHDFIVVIGALRPAEDDGRRVVFQRVGQGIAEARPADVEHIAAVAQRQADATGRGQLTVENSQDAGRHAERRIMS